jgi:glutamine---fructose-6-phosphate transaminase (isomerizing)
MCGIAGYVGQRPAAPIIVACLERLQYRGYDSAGMALRNNGEIQVSRVMGLVEGLIRERAPNLNATLGVGHTRWATHGLPSVENAHPLVSCDESIAVVQNGIIENHAELRRELEGKGHRFRSATDSEVIPHLLEEEMRAGKTFRAAFGKLHGRLIGTFAIVAAHKDYPYLLVTRRGSPLVIGVGDGEYFPASDIPCFLGFTQKVLYIREEDCLQIDTDGIHRFDGETPLASPIDAPLTLVDLDLAHADRAGQDHFMIKEILEQDEILERILLLDPAAITRLGQSIRSSRQVFFAGAGTSYHSSLYAEYCAMSLGIANVRSVVSSEFGHFAPQLGSKDLVVLLSQSGETADTLAAGRLARLRGASVGAIVNSPLSTIVRESDASVPISCGMEVAVAATKSYTAQLTTILLSLCHAAGVVSRGTSTVREASNSLYNLTSDTSRRLVKQIAQDLGSSRDVYLLGRGLQNVTARESALKLKEVAGVRAEAFFLGEMKHGPLSLIDDSSRVILFFGDADYASAKTGASELASRGARIYTVGPRPIAESSYHIQTPDIDLGLPICQIAPVQLLSYELARMRNLNPDRPRNLAKSVTVA